MTGPLSGIRIIDLSAIVAGPMAAMLLGDQGADVIKVEPVGIGDLVRWLGPQCNGVGALFAGCNRSKRSLALNLKDEAGKAILRDLLKDADVLIQNFRPGAMARLGFGYEEMARLNPGLIYVSMSGFGQSGPYVKRRVYDPVIQAISGFADSQSDAAANEPHLIQSIVCDKVTALTAAQAITAALFARATGNSKGGQHLELSMLDAAVQFLFPEVFYNHAFLAEGATTSPDFARFYDILKTKDGFVTSITLSDDEFGDFCRAIDQPELANDPRFRTITSRMAHAEFMREKMRGHVAGFETAELLRRFEAEDVPHARVNRRAEVPADPQIRHNGTIVELDHPKAGRMRVARHAANFSETPAAIARHAPSLGEHTDAILAELGRSASDIASLRAAKTVG